MAAEVKFNKNLLDELLAGVTPRRCSSGTGYWMI